MTGFAERWIENLADVWRKRDVEAAVDLFKYCRTYKESPFEENAALTSDGIRNLWKEVIHQSEISVSASIRVQNNDRAIAEYEAIYAMDGVHYRSSGIWIVGFKDEHCVSFEQWFMSRTQDTVI
jgi:hypothetical protein